MNNYTQLSLFSVSQYQSIPHVCDPTWDKLETRNRQHAEVATQPVASVESQPSSEKFATEHSPPIQVVDTPVATEQTNTEVKVKPKTTDASKPNKCVRLQVATNTSEVATEQSHLDKKNTQWVETYWVKRKGEKHYYYRYCWMEGRKQHNVHIGGGNVRSPLAWEIKQEVEEAIQLELPPFQIKSLIRLLHSSKVRS